MTEAGAGLEVVERPGKWGLRGLAGILAAFAGGLWIAAGSIEEPFNYLLGWPILWLVGLALALLVAANEGWDRARLVAVEGRFVTWLWAAPLGLIAAGLGLWAVVALFGWLGSIPGWAAVIIVLLILISYQLDRR